MRKKPSKADWELSAPLPFFPGTQRRTTLRQLAALGPSASGEAIDQQKPIRTVDRIPSLPLFSVPSGAVEPSFCIGTPRMRAGSSAEDFLQVLSEALFQFRLSANAVFVKQNTKGRHVEWQPCFGGLTRSQ